MLFRSKRLMGWGIAAAAVVGLGAAPALACGPGFPNTILSATDEQLLASPVADFRLEVEAIAREIRSPFRAATHGEAQSLWDQTEQADLADLRAALEDTKVPAEQRQAIIAQYTQLRKIIANHQTAMHAWAQAEVPIGEPESVSSTNWRLCPFPRVCPESSPTTSAAPSPFIKTSWPRRVRRGDALLKRPADQRHYRSTWAAFMLGQGRL